MITIESRIERISTNVQQTLIGITGTKHGLIDPGSDPGLPALIARDGGSSERLFIRAPQAGLSDGMER